MLAALGALGGGGGLSASASSSATSGDAKGGNFGLQVGGIQTGGSQGGGVPSWVWIAAAAVALVFLLRKR